MLTEVNATEKTVSAFTGFTGKSKCTFQFVAAGDVNEGPVFKLSQAKFARFIVNYIEWYSTTGFAAGAILPATAVASGYHIGAYPVAGGVYLNPLKSSSITAETSLPFHSAAWFYSGPTETKKRGDGSVGTAIFYNKQEGPTA
jgi:hypothetical protein